MAASTKEQRRQSRDRARERARQDPSVVPHGTSTGYGYWACRCADCTAAATAATGTSRHGTRAKAGADPSLIPHGTHNGYLSYGCRCPDCREVHADYMRAWNKRRADAARAAAN